MVKILCSSQLTCPIDKHFLYQTKYIRRAGIIPYMDVEGVRYYLLGLSKETNPVWADLGGRAEDGETTLETALREFGEESRWVIKANLSNITKIIITDRKENGKIDQALLFMKLEPTTENIYIDNMFQSTIPKTKYEDEMQFLKWIPASGLGSLKTTKSLKTVFKLI